MSFILDALKKSEAERQRQSGPTLLEVRVSAPRRRYPLWALIVGALLLINVVVLALFLLRRPSPPATPVAQSAPSTPAAASPTAASTPAATATPSALTALPAAVAPPVEPLVPPADNSSSDSANPSDDVPAVRPEHAPRSATLPDTSGYASLPSSTDIGNLPDLRLDLHVYTDRASDRYALINMHRVREGDTLPEGPKVLAITRDGVALDFRGQDFMLRPQ